eukprot:TRINITY_DN13602_c0_g1::TRINITY_DN13602_c0_g1_i1::g.22146::m.22146 TRINITY_DN13602_c0_g1::TRINITY_DN13602_c0_g1_i1::g.22146  ORF type:complete len:110 (-),score=7.12,sp/O74948/T2AG_SCHPO/53.54/4e-34,TFIIA_gamma_C/PF02751.9/8.7e-22,TFIIA_gamma_N/PF02268.11/4.6e-20 TRINITY_DN13602_c0_g1_i1:71-400(-)
MSTQYYEFYRESTLGQALCASLDELVEKELITATLALKVLKQFDKSMMEAFRLHIRNRMNFKGDLRTFRFCDNVWTLCLANASFRIENETVTADKVKIVACEGPTTKEK